MEDSYISNIGNEMDGADLEMLDRINQLEIDCEKYKIEIKELKKELLDQKHHITDLEIESDHNLETIKNQNGLIKFYKQYRLEHEDDAQQQKIALFEEKIKSLEDSLAIKDKKIKDLNEEIKEQNSLNEKLVDVITNKEEAIKKLERGQSGDITENNTNNNVTKLEEEIENLKNKISDLQNESEKTNDQYENKINYLNKENNNYQDQIYDLENEIIKLKEINKKYEIEEAKNKGGPEAEKEVEKLYKEEIENLKKSLEEAKQNQKIKKKKQNLRRG